MSSRMILFLILGVTTFTDYFSLIIDEDRYDWCYQCPWTKVDILAADFNVWLWLWLFLFFNRKVSVSCTEELTDRSFILNKTKWFWGKCKLFIHKYYLLFQLLRIFNCSVLRFFFYTHYISSSEDKTFVWCHMGVNGALRCYSVSEGRCQSVFLNYSIVPISKLQLLLCIFVPFKNSNYKHDK